MLKSINYFISLFLDTFKLFGRVKAWLLFLSLGFVYWLLLYSHYQFTDPLFYGFIAWWTKLWDPQYAGGFTHYPGHFILMSYYYSSAKLFIGFFIEGGLLGAAAAVFYRYIFTETKETNYSLSSNLNNWLHLSLSWGILNAVLFAGYKFLPQIFASFLWSSPRRQMIFDYGVIPLFNILIVAIFFFAIPYIAIYRTNVLNGIIQSFKIFIRRPIFTFFLAAAILTVPLILSLILNNPAVLVDKFKPILIYWLLLAGIVLDIFVNFFWMGTAVNFLSDEE